MTPLVYLYSNFLFLLNICDINKIFKTKKLRKKENLKIQAPKGSSENLVNITDIKKKNKV
jgi:hypothetical protein